jgi:hypothetical protein
MHTHTKRSFGMAIAFAEDRAKALHKQGLFEASIATAATFNVANPVKCPSFNP